jgi:2-methylcitrate dehydratase PrpD
MNTVVKPAALKSKATADAAEGTISERLAAFAGGLDASRIPAEAVERAKLHILDCFGIGLASTTYEFGHRMANAMHGLGGDGPYPVIGLPMRLPLRDSVHLNGTLIHGLDFDDTHGGGVIHASTSALPTALGTGLANKASGLDTLAAYLVGVEASARIGLAVNGNFHRAGHHPTGLVGAFGCTLAAGRLGDLSVPQIVHAQGIALSMAGGSLEFLSDGAWTKRQHPGWAGVCGITAAGMAKQGFVGPKEAYEGRYGLFKLHLGCHIGGTADYDLTACTKGLGEEWELFNVAFKPYPACHFNHAFVDAALALRDTHGLRPEDVDSVTALIGEGQMPVVCEPEADKRRPKNAYEAQFSVHYIIAAALTRGRFTLDELDASAFTDPAVVALCDRITFAADPDTNYPRYYSGEVVVRTKDGRELRHREAHNRGSDANPLTVSDIEAKYWANATRAVSRERAQRVLDAVMGLDKADDLMELGDALCLA